jgi:hypothetical protein
MAIGLAVSPLSDGHGQRFLDILHGPEGGLIYEIHFPRPGGLFEEGSLLARTFPECRNRVRIARARLSEEQIAVLHDFILAPHSVPARYQDALEELWSCIGDDPLLFFMTMTLPSQDIDRLKSRFRSGKLAGFSFEEQIVLSALHDTWLEDFLKCYASYRTDFQLSDRDLFRVAFKRFQTSGRGIVDDCLDLGKIATALQFGPADVDALLWLMPMGEREMALLLEDPDFSPAPFAAQCLAYRLQLLSYHSRPNLCPDLPSNLALDMYYYACTFELDENWIRHLVVDMQNVDEVETQYRQRRDVRVRAPTADIEFRSTFLKSLIPPHVGWRWWIASFLVVPLAWFLGAKGPILQSILEADC